MKKSSVPDYLAYTALKALGVFLRMLPLGAVFFIGSAAGRFLYLADRRHRALVYSNLKTAFGDELSVLEIKKLCRKFYEKFCQSAIEVFLIPRFDAKYIEKYISIEGRENIDKAFKRGKGVIFLSVHAGSWEVSGIICEYLKIPYRLFVQDLKSELLNNILAEYRHYKGKTIDREKQLRSFIKLLKDNESVGITLDQGGREGVPVDFFGKQASMATGALKMALKYDCAIVPVYNMRLKGPYVKFFVEPQFELDRGDGEEDELKRNLERLVKIFEGYIRRYPQEYLWNYKIWKHSRSKDILILSDEKPGHLKQSSSLAEMASKFLKAKGIDSRIHTVNVKFKNSASKKLLTCSLFLSDRYSCQGCLGCLKVFLRKDSYEALLRLRPDVVISCGSSLAAANLVVARENQARSISVMRPSILPLRLFDLVVMPEHDEPPQLKNVVASAGALSLVSEEYLKASADNLKTRIPGHKQGDGYISIFIGGNTRDFILEKKKVEELLAEIKKASGQNGLYILATTSRRTSKEIEALVKAELKDYPECRLLIIANEKNIPNAPAGMLGLCTIAVVTPESVSMITEAVNAVRYAAVFDSALSGRHGKFLDYFRREGFLYCAPSGQFSSLIERLLKEKPVLKRIEDEEKIRAALARFL